MSVFLDALNNKNHTDRYPVWLMRQAGRYLPNYQKLRKSHHLKTLFTTPELIYQTTLLPFEYFDLDAAIIFWDILLIAEELGFDIRYSKKKGPIAKYTGHKKKIDYQTEAIRKVKNNIKVPLIGFCGAPFTVASYLLNDIKQWVYQKPEQLHVHLVDLCNASIKNLKSQVEAGVDAIQIFESSADMLNHDLLKEFSFNYVQKICQEIDVPKIVFAKGACTFHDIFSKLNVNAVGFDWHMPLFALRNKIPNDLAIQGNFDPDLLFAPKEVIEKQVNFTLKKMNNDSGLIINLGHGVKPHTPVQAVQWFVESAKSFSRSNN